MPPDSTDPSKTPDTPPNSPFGKGVTLGEAKSPPVEITPAPKPEAVPALLHGQQNLVPSEINNAKALPEPAPLSAWVTGELTDEQRTKLDISFKKARSGVASSIPMVCQGTKCAFLAMCPLYQAKVSLPVSSPCPVEEATISAWKRDFIYYLAVPDDHPNKGLIYALIDDLAITVAMQNRVLWSNANEPEIFRDEVIGANQHGDPIIAKRLNTSLDLLSRLSANKMRILREFLSTPKAEVEAKRKMGIDPSSQAAATMAKLKNIGGHNVIEASFVKVDVNGSDRSKN